jgi:hypothetical protein
MTTHYIPSFTTVNRRGQQMAACGAPVTEAAYATEPTCPQCAAWLAQDAADFAATEAATFDPPPVRLPAEPDPVAEYERAFDRRYGRTR